MFSTADLADYLGFLVHAWYFHVLPPMHLDGHRDRLIDTFLVAFIRIFTSLNISETGVSTYLSTDPRLCRVNLSRQALK